MSETDDFAILWDGISTAQDGYTFKEDSAIEADALAALRRIRTQLQQAEQERDSFQRIGIATGLELEHAIEAVNEGAAINDGLRETVSELETEAASLRTQLQQAETALRAVVDYEVDLEWEPGAGYLKAIAREYFTSSQEKP